MFLSSGVKSECCGCGACAQACPHSCITMLPDEDGFLFPEASRAACAGCGLCEAVCPIAYVPAPAKAPQGEPLLAAAKSKDEGCIMAAASGGAFGEIVRTLRRNGRWLVWGAAFDADLQLSHRCSQDETDLAPLHKSKYVQSRMGDAFREIRAQLGRGEHVLFSGTPCQTAALRRFLADADTGRLVCVDLLCHGVPSQKMFDAYLREEGTRFHSRIKSVQFRFKVYRKWRREWNPRTILLTTEDGRRRVQNRQSSRFLRAYHSALCYRESCYSCVFANPARQGDLTLADFWGIERFYPELDAGRGVSLIQANTEKGRVILSRLEERMDIYPVDRDAYLKSAAGTMVRPSPRHGKREAFLEYSRTHPFCASVDRFLPKYRRMIKARLAQILSPEIRARLKRLIKIPAPPRWKIIPYSARFKLCPLPGGLRSAAGITGKAEHPQTADVLSAACWPAGQAAPVCAAREGIMRPYLQPPAAA